MNVKELKELLSKLPDDMLIIMQKDSEGNGYSPLSGGDPDCRYRPENTWSGEVFGEDEKDYYLEEEELDIETLEKVLVLYPIN